MKILAFVALVVVASGCTQTTTDTPNPGDGGTVNPSNGVGLKIVDFYATDNTIRKSQGTPQIILLLENHHQEEITINDISLYNTAFLNVEKQGCTPEDIAPAKNDLYPQMKCTWNVEVPQDADMSSFDSRTIPIKLNLEYESSMLTQPPTRIKFKPESKVNQTSGFTRTYENGELRVNVKSESPAPTGGVRMDISMEAIGKGRLDSQYTLDTKSGILESCSPDISGEIERYPGEPSKVTCTAKPERQIETTQNFVFSISYKYIKAPTLDIEVVNE